MKALWLPSSMLVLVAILIGLAGLASESAWQDELADLRYRRFDPYIRLMAHRHLPPHHDWTLLKALVRQESRFDPRARSSAGALGLCQLMPATARDLGLEGEELFDPIRNLDAGARYLSWLMDEWPRLPDHPPHWTRTRFALASYNAGIGTVQKAWKEAAYTSRWEVLKGHLPAETQTYVAAIMDHHYPLYRAAGRHQLTGFRSYLRAQHNQSH